MRKKIDTLEKLEKFISDESISKENRFKVFAEALKGYELNIFEIKNGENANIDDPENKLLSEMKRILSEIKAQPESFIAGFVVLYKQ